MVLELVGIFLRLLQYAGLSTLFGASLFFLYALPSNGVAAAHNLAWPRALLIWGAAILSISSAAGLVAQTIVMTGSIQDGLTTEALAVVAFDTDLGYSALVRVAAGFAAIIALGAYKSARAWWLAAGTGAVACVSIPWMGHGAATEGTWWLPHVLSDIVHTVAASIWVGALLSFGLLLTICSPRSLESERALQRALAAFSGIGSVLVVILLATGLANAWFIVGGVIPWQGFWDTAYGRVLSAKVAVFGLMLCLAAVNRFRLTRDLEDVLDQSGVPTAPLRCLRRSITAETSLGFGALALVAWLGTLAPPVTQ